MPMFLCFFSIVNVVLFTYAYIDKRKPGFDAAGLYLYSLHLIVQGPPVV